MVSPGSRAEPVFLRPAGRADQEARVQAPCPRGSLLAHPTARNGRFLRLRGRVELALGHECPAGCLLCTLVWAMLSKSTAPEKGWSPEAVTCWAPKTREDGSRKLIYTGNHNIPGRSAQPRAKGDKPLASSNKSHFRPTGRPPAKRSIRIAEGVAYVSLPCGREFLLDEADLGVLDDARWVSKVRLPGRQVCVQGRMDGRWVALHRYLLQPDDGQVVDHINGDGLDNRRCNLRVCSQMQNLRNSRIRTDNTSGFKGVSPQCNRWQASISVSGRPIFLGSYATPEDAAAAYDHAARTHFGIFAALNFPETGERAARATEVSR